MNDNIYLTGNTIRLKAIFKDNIGNPKDPDMVKIIFYNYRYEKIDEFSLGQSHKIGIGEYVYDYVSSDNETRIYYEFNGEIAGNPAIQRSGFMTKFIV